MVCSNYGHYTNQCHIKFFTHCAHQLVDHDYHNCPYKQNKQNNAKSGNYPTKHRDNKGHKDKGDNARERSENREKGQETKDAGNQNGETG